MHTRCTYIRQLQQPPSNGSAAATAGSTLTSAAIANAGSRLLVQNVQGGGVTMWGGAGAGAGASESGGSASGERQTWSAPMTTAAGANV